MSSWKFPAHKAYRISLEQFRGVFDICWQADNQKDKFNPILDSLSFLVTRERPSNSYEWGMDSRTGHGQNSTSLYLCSLFHLFSFVPRTEAISR